MSADDSLPLLARTRTLDRDVLVGLFVILGVTASLIALFVLTDAALFRGRYLIETVVADAGGIRRGDPVQMRGVNIGRVASFRIVPAGVAVALEIEGQYSIPADSRIELVANGLLGGLAARVVPGTAGHDVGWGAVLPGESQTGIFDQFGTLQAQAGEVLARVQALVDERTVDDVHHSSSQLRELLATLNDLASRQQVELEATSRHLRRAAEKLDRATAGPEIERSLQHVAALTARLDEIVTSLGRSSQSLEGILGRMDRGEGVLGRLSRDEELYANATAAAASLQRAGDELARLAADVRENPGRYINLKFF